MAEVKFWVNTQVTLDEVLAKRYAALHQAGITKTEVIRRALVFFLDRRPVEILDSIGLVTQLGDPTAVELNKYTYEPVPEPEAVAAGQGSPAKKS